jgi:putative endonuclease
MAKDDHLQRGRSAEAWACEQLTRRGLRLVARNYRCKGGELDLIMRERDVLVFVEVRYRRSDRYGSGEETVGRRKQAKLVTAALHFLQTTGRSDTACRFDVVSISDNADGEPDMRWIRDAFQA